MLDAHPLPDKVGDLSSLRVPAVPAPVVPLRSAGLGLGGEEVLLDAGLVHPVPDPPAAQVRPAEVTVVVPVGAPARKVAAKKAPARKTAAPASATKPAGKPAVKRVAAKKVAAKKVAAKKAPARKSAR